MEVVEMLELLSDILGRISFLFILHVTSAGQFPRPLSDEEEQECLQRLAQGDSSAADKLVEHNLRLVAHIVKKYYSTGADPDDLVSVGTEAHNYLLILNKEGREFLTRMTFTAASDILLKDKRFLPVRRGVIVNMAYIQNFDDRLLNLTVGSPVPINPRNRSKLEQIWDNYLVDRMRSDILRGGMS